VEFLGQAALLLVRAINPAKTSIWVLMQLYHKIWCQALVAGALRLWHEKLMTFHLFCIACQCVGMKNGSLHRMARAAVV
jgi:hypothetical protein